MPRNAKDDLIATAREFDLEVGKTLAERGIDGLRQAFKEVYMLRNQAAIEASRAYVRQYGTLAQQFGLLKRDED